MGTKDTVRALLDRLPDDCSIDDVIERLYLLREEDPREEELAPLTDAQQKALDEAVEQLERDPGNVAPWHEFRRKLERDL